MFIGNSFEELKRNGFAAAVHKELHRRMVGVARMRVVAERELAYRLRRLSYKPKSYSMYISGYRTKRLFQYCGPISSGAPEAETHADDHGYQGQLGALRGISSPEALSR